jgi:hypothetical protein
MNRSIDALFDGTAFQPAGPVDLEANTRAPITIESVATEEKVAGVFLETAKFLRLNGPADFSSNLDKYLYGGAAADES